MFWPSDRNAQTKTRMLLAMRVLNFVVPRAGIEPAPLSGPDFESGASTNFTTRARREDFKHSTSYASKKVQ